MPFEALASDHIDRDRGVVLRIERVVHGYDSPHYPMGPFGKSWGNCRRYVAQCLRLLKMDRADQLTEAQVRKIRAKAPRPPKPCYPIYFITVRDRVQATPVAIPDIPLGEGEVVVQFLPQPEQNNPQPIAKPEERLMYVGKASNIRRFHGGHHALSKLLHPKYEGRDKLVYAARVAFFTRNGHLIPLEWIQSNIVSAHWVLIFLEFPGGGKSTVVVLGR